MKLRDILSPSFRDYRRPHTPLVVVATDSDFCRETVDSGVLTAEQMAHAAARYRLGKSKSGRCIFWMIDEAGKVRDGRIGNEWVSAMMEAREPVLLRGCRTEHCLYGLHLVHTDNNGHTESTESTERVITNTNLTNNTNKKGHTDLTDLTDNITTATRIKGLAEIAESAERVITNTNHTNSTNIKGHTDLTDLTESNTIDTRIKGPAERAESAERVITNTNHTNSTNIKGHTDSTESTERVITNTNSTNSTNIKGRTESADSAERVITNTNHTNSTNNISKSVCIVDDERTAVILSELFPECLWMAAMYPLNMNVRQLEPLRGRHVVLYPHTDSTMSHYVCWLEIAETARQRLHMDVTCNRLLEDYATEEQKGREIDLVGFLTEHTEV